MKIGRNKYEIHFGTSWDFLKVHSITPRYFIIQLAHGLLKICNDIECNKLNPETKFKAYSYFLKEGTIKKIGFKWRRYNFAEYVIFFISYIEAITLKSIANKKFSLINIKNIKVLTTTGKDILDNKQFYYEFILRLDKSFLLNNSEVADVA